MKDRRAAVRIEVTPPLDARLSGVRVRIVELSTIGALLEHEERFGLENPELEIVCQGTPVRLPLVVVRSQIAGHGGGRLTYRSGIEFTGDQLLAQHVLSILLTEMGVAPEPAPQDPAPAASPSSAPAPRPTPTAPPVERSVPRSPEPSLDDSWTRRVRFLHDDSEDDLPFATYHRVGDHWTKEYAATPDQPADGFTVLRGDPDFAEIQHAFEYADDDTRRMMQIALLSKLEGAKVR